MGDGKTERFVLNGESDSTLKTSTNIKIPEVPDYKYLGVHVLDFDTDFSKRKGKAWAAFKNNASIWTSSADPSVKRHFFTSLLEPIMTYGLCAWPITKKREEKYNGLQSRMLRRAVNLPKSFGYVNGIYARVNDVHTEDVFGTVPFMSTQIRTRRVDLLAHAYRAHTRAVDPARNVFIDVLTFDAPGHIYRNRTGNRLTLKQSLLEDTDLTLDELLSQCNYGKSQKLRESVEKRSQKVLWDEIYIRRKQNMTREAQAKKTIEDRDNMLLADLIPLLGIEAEARKERRRERKEKQEEKKQEIIRKRSEKMKTKNLESHTLFIGVTTD